MVHLARSWVSGIIMFMYPIYWITGISSNNINWLTLFNNVCAVHKNKYFNTMCRYNTSCCCFALFLLLNCILYNEAICCSISLNLGLVGHAYMHSLFMLYYRRHRHKCVIKVCLYTNIKMKKLVEVEHFYVYDID